MKNKHYLLSTIETRFKTIMIGSIARVEEYFGYLWGHGKENDELTDRHKEFKRLWEELRTEILNHGNFNIRKGLDDIENILDNEEKKYQYKFMINKNRRED